MNLSEIYRDFVIGLQQTGAIEFIAVISGIISVWFSQKANIWVYPTGIISTTIYIYISIKGHLLGEASVNTFYTIMSIYGWILWAKKDEKNKNVLLIQHSSVKEWILHLFFLLPYMLPFILLCLI
ncbi:MAG: nicotinamide riboside transporter PnuC [Segetibacter sp.]